MKIIKKTSKKNLEIERKFKVKYFPAGKVSYGKEFKQGILFEDPQTISFCRIRVVDDSKAFLTIKRKTNEESSAYSNREFEYEIDVHEGLQLFEMSSLRIEKTRYLVQENDHVWELDSFGGSLEGLLLAELELSSEKEDFDKPDWVGEEVFGKGWTNTSLAKNGIPKE